MLVVCVYQSFIHLLICNADKHLNGPKWLLRSRQGRHQAEYCDERHSVCLTVREHISGTTRPIFINYVHVTYRCNSVLSSGGIAICYVLPGLLDVVVFT